MEEATWIEPDAPVKVLTRTALCGTSGAIVGSLMGIARTVHAIPLAFNVGLNTSIVAFTFFSFREYMMLPLSQRFELDQPSFHTKHLLESAAAGGMTGGLLLSYRHGLRRFPSGAFTAALAASTLQFIVNEVSYARIAYAARQEAAPAADQGPKVSFMDRLSSHAPIRKLSEEEVAARKARAERAAAEKQAAAAETEAELRRPP